MDYGMLNYFAGCKKLSSCVESDILLVENIVLCLLLCCQICYFVGVFRLIFLRLVIMGNYFVASITNRWFAEL